MLRINPPGTNKTFEFNGAHITMIDDDGRHTLRTLGTPEFDATWYNESHRNVMHLVFELEKALLEMEKA